MSLLVPIEDAARNVLATWIASELAAVSGLVVQPHWFERDRQLPAKAISIIESGPRQLTWLEPTVLDSTNVDMEDSDAVTKVDATWCWGFVTCPLQLDVWATNEPELKDIVARLDLALNQGAAGIGGTKGAPFEAGLLLTLGDGWGPGVADFLFEQTSNPLSPESAVQGEWRAMRRGRATAQLTQVARSNRMARILLAQRLRQADPVDEDAAVDTTEVLPAS